jgi:hypothetical protein
LPKETCWSENYDEDHSFTSYIAGTIAEDLKTQSDNREPIIENISTNNRDIQNEPSKSNKVDESHALKYCSVKMKPNKIKEHSLMKPVSWKT